MFPFVALPLVVEVAAWIGAGTVAAAAGKAIYDKVNESDSSSSSSSSTEVNRSGPTHEEVVNRERARLYDEFSRNVCQFWKEHDFILCVKDEAARNRCRALPSRVRRGEISPEQALHQLWQDEAGKNLLGGAVPQNVAEGLLWGGVSSLEGFVNVLANRLGARHLPLPLLGDHYELCRMEGLVERLKDAVKARLEGKSVQLPGDVPEREDLAELWAAFCAARDALPQTTPCVVVCGLLKGGKSSLLNSIFDDTQDATFKVGMTRTTAANQCVERFGASFVDTPGLEADETDTSTAWEAYRKADLLVFVHAAERELTIQEIDFMKSLRSSGVDLPSHLVCVISLTDLARDSLDSLKDRIQSQLQEALGLTLPLHCVSSRRYKKENLRHASGVPELRDLIVRRCQEMSATLKTRHADEMERTKRALEGRISRIEQDAKADRKRLEAERNAAWNGFERSVIERTKREFKDVESHG